MAKLLACAACALSIVASMSVAPRRADARSQATDRLIESIKESRHTTWRLQTIMGIERTERLVGDPISIPRLQKRWDRHARRVLRKFRRGPAHRREWLCIHRYEGSWTDPNAPYYGGLQMDITFQRSYGGYLFHTKGTADNWTPLEQMWVAERAYRVRGFYPWPNTARYCGLI